MYFANIRVLLLQRLLLSVPVLGVEELVVLELLVRVKVHGDCNGAAPQVRAHRLDLVCPAVSAWWRRNAASGRPEEIKQELVAIAGRRDEPVVLVAPDDLV